MSSQSPRSIGAQKRGVVEGSRKGARGGRLGPRPHTHHARATAVVAVLHLGARLVPFAITPLTGISDVHGELLVDTLGSLIECQLHDVLKISRDRLLSLLK